jgi:hypothetical protein
LKVKITAVIIVCLILCPAALGIPAFLAEKYRNLFFVLPSEIRSPSFDIQEIEDFSEKDFLISYEIPGSERVSLSHAEYPVTLIATNSSYPGIFGFSMSEGAFFSKQAWTGKQRHAVLNETAAFTVFGSTKIVGSRFRIRNDVWLVTGVISGGDEDKARIYIPSSVRGGEAAALALTGGLDEAYVRNSLKTLGIQEGNFNFINMGTQCSLLWERAEVILLLFFAFLFLSLLKPLIGEFRKARSALKRELARLYAVEILQRHRKSFYKMGFLGLGLVFFPILVLFLFLRLASVCLPWQDIPSLTNLNREFFLLQLSRIRSLEQISGLFFGFSLVFLAIFFVRLNAFPTERKKAV